ncbi:MAG: hypothetical protein ACI4OG_03005 [Bacilli bacterium]
MMEVTDQIIERAILMAAANIAMEEDLKITPKDIQMAKSFFETEKVKKKGIKNNGRHMG